VNGLILACESGNLELVELLANVEEMSCNHFSATLARMTPLVAAVSCSHHNVAKFLIEDDRFDTQSMVTVNDKEISQLQLALRIACSLGNLQIVEMLIAAGVVLNDAVRGFQVLV
jgi:ankyrin repeat protein